MATIVERESTQYLYLGVTGSQPSVGAKVAFLAAGIRPNSDGSDWYDAILVNPTGDTLSADAVRSGVTGDYYVARLVGSFGTNDLVLTAGDYTQWIQLTGATEQQVLIAPITLTVE